MNLNWLLYFLAIIGILLIAGIIISILMLKSLFKASESVYFIDEGNEMLTGHTWEDEDLLGVGSGSSIPKNNERILESELV